jgi:hypothetical protein
LNTVKFILDQLGRFWFWVQQDGNSNIVLVVITGWYSWLTFRMLRWSAVTARTGEASRLMLMNEQRAWLLVSLPANASEAVARFVPDPMRLEILYIYPVLRNYGKTIARITLAKARLVALPDAQPLPAEPDYEGPDFHTVAATTLLPPDAPAQGLQPGISSMNFTPVRERNATLWLYGFVDYLDLNDRPHQTRFCFKYHVPGGFNPTPEGFYVFGPDAPEDDSHYCHGRATIDRCALLTI